MLPHCDLRAHHPDGRASSEKIYEECCYALVTTTAANEQSRKVQFMSNDMAADGGNYAVHAIHHGADACGFPCLKWTDGVRLWVWTIWVGRIEQG